MNYFRIGDAHLIEPHSTLAVMKLKSGKSGDPNDASWVWFVGSTKVVDRQQSKLLIALYAILYNLQSLCLDSSWLWDASHLRVGVTFST